MRQEGIEMLTMGVDIGSTASKAVVMCDGNEIVSECIIPVGTGTRGPKEVFQKALEKAQITEDQVDRILATGYGRLGFKKAARELSELSCHAKGVHYLVPEAGSVIDIGGQDAKAIRLDENGALDNFTMNDKCAAGTGRFLEVMARVLDVKVEDMGDISLKSEKQISISSTCAVFAESEVISRLANEETIEDIAAGIHRSVAKKVASLLVRMGPVRKNVVMSGGVAKNGGVVRALEKEIGCEITVPEKCQLAGAIGAAIYAYEDLMKEKKGN